MQHALTMTKVMGRAPEPYMLLEAAPDLPPELLCRYIGQIYRHPLGDGTIEDNSVKVSLLSAVHPFPLLRIAHLRSYLTHALG